MAQTLKQPRIVHERIIEESPAYHDNRSSAAFTFSSLVYYLLGILEVLLALRLLLRLFAANTASPFVAFIYRLAAPLTAPFQNIFRNTPLETGGSVEWSTVVAMAVYALVAYAIVELVQRLKQA